MERTEVVPVPPLTHMRPVLQCHRLVTHREGPDADPQFFIEVDVETHPLVEVRRSVHEVVQHVIGQGGDLVVCRHANRPLVDLPHADVVEGDSQWADAYGGHFTQEHVRLGEDSCVHALVEVHSPLDRPVSVAGQFGSRREPEVAYLGNHLPVTS